MSNHALLFSLNEIEEQLKLNQFKLLIIDSINNYYRSEQGDGKISFNKTKT
ncbi:unnamed protein product, partial [marine sediment metagenome]